MSGMHLPVDRLVNKICDIWVRKMMPLIYVSNGLVSTYFSHASA